MSTKTFWLKLAKPTIVVNFEHQVLLSHIRDNQWHHCAIVYNGDTTYYVDGLRVATNPQKALMGKIEKYTEYNENLSDAQIMKERFNAISNNTILKR